MAISVLKRLSLIVRGVFEKVGKKISSRLTAKKLPKDN